MCFGYAQTVPAIASFETSWSLAMLDDVGAHQQVGVPVAARIRAVRADPADLGGEVEDDLGPRLGEQPLGVVEAREVVVPPPRGHDLVPLALEPLGEVRAEEPASAGDEDPAHVARTGCGLSQSTRPSQRLRFSAYQRIVRRTPSSHETSGRQPVSSWSFS